jgi:hypothetical protein
MRLKTLIALAAVGLAVAAPAALAQATRAKVSLLFVLEGTSARLDPVEGQAGIYTFTMPIRTAKHPVIWSPGRPAPPRAVGGPPKDHRLGDPIRGDLPVVPNDNGWCYVPYPKPSSAGR